jgi:glycosyltransferase involved in cell wall biosynthesis
VKVAIIHYWLTSYRGGEKVLSELCKIYPDADIYTHVYDEDNPELREFSGKVKKTFISRLPFAKRWYQKYLPLMPLALEEIDLRGYDLVISSESGPAKGVVVPPGVPHICYCHSPMRYVWDMYPNYSASLGRFGRLLFSFIAHYLRRWDQLNSQQVTRFIANSNFVKARIKSYYNVEASVIFPPVDVKAFDVTESNEDFYLVLGQLVDYKRADIAVEAFNESGKKLVVIGEGEMYQKLSKIAEGNIELRGRVTFSEVKDAMKKCKALVFPGVEDFGIVPVEAMACGKPVIAYGKGGARDTVIDGVTGLFFHSQTAASLNAAIEKFESIYGSFDAQKIREHAENYDSETFVENIVSEINSVIS